MTYFRLLLQLRKKDVGLPKNNFLLTKNTVQLTRIYQDPLQITSFYLLSKLRKKDVVLFKSVMLAH